MLVAVEVLVLPQAARETAIADILLVKPVDYRSGFPETVLRIGLGYLSNPDLTVTVPGACMDGVLPRDGDLELKHMLSGLSLKGPSVHAQGDGFLIGIDCNFGYILGPVHIPSARDMNKGIGLVPVGFVQVEGVLLGLAVDGDKALLIFAVLAALVPSVGSKVEDVPCRW